jgi:predicted phage terminase large subunit-like protein
MTRPIGVKSEGSKQDRIAAQTAKIEAGHFYLPVEAHWLPIFSNEILAFPNARHDDQVDASRSFFSGCSETCKGDAFPSNRRY